MPRYGTEIDKNGAPVAVPPSPGLSSGGRVIAPLPRTRAQHHADFGSDGDWSMWSPKDAELEIEADRLRRELGVYEDRFDVRVANDTRAAAMCRECKGFVVGERADLGKIEREILAHVCAVEKAI